MRWNSSANARSLRLPYDTWFSSMLSVLTLVQGFSLANSTSLPMYAFLQQHPDRARRFASAMSNTSPASLAMMQDLYPWASLPKGSVVVDVGGARGHVSAHLAEHFPDLQFIVQDLPEVVDDSASTDHTTEAPYQLPETVRGRVKLMAHDFFDKQPVEGAAVYFIRYTLHNWSDEYCIKILRRLVEAMQPNSQIVIQDHLLLEPGQMSPSKERNARQVHSKWKQ